MHVHDCTMLLLVLKKLQTLLIAKVFNEHNVHVYVHNCHVNVSHCFLYKNVVFLAQAEYYYFSADFRLKIFFNYSL